MYILTNVWHLTRIPNNSGNVYEATIKGEKGRVAVKILKNNLSNPEKAYQREVEALKRTHKNPYIVRLRGYCTDPYYCIITDLCEAGTPRAHLLISINPL